MRSKGREEKAKRESEVREQGVRAFEGLLASVCSVLLTRVGSREWRQTERYLASINGLIRRLTHVGG